MSEPNAPEFSIVIPAFNEAERLGSALEDTTAYLGQAPGSWEVIVVDDGSTDRTSAVVDEWSRREPRLRGLRLERNCGKGAAVRAGVLAARGAYIVFRDADDSTAMRELDKFRPLLSRGVPVVIGSRRVPGARYLRHQPWLRESLGKCFTGLCRLLLVRSVRDYTCGFKAFSAAAAKDIFFRQRIPRWGFDAEILFLASRLGYAIMQVPVAWKDDPGTKVRLWLDPLRTLGEILQIRLNCLRGLYRL